MKGDFTRDSFDLSQHYTRVLMQQGRVQLDADWNEQAAITQHYLRRLAADLIGPFGGPRDDCGFAIVTAPAQIDTVTGKDCRTLTPERVVELKKHLEDGDFLIGTGRYYVDGLLCEHDVPLTYAEQPGYPFDDESTLQALRGAKQFLVYLDVWERHVTAVEDPDLLEVALGGPDTTSRAQLVWQVKILKADSALSSGSIDLLQRPPLPLLRARTRRRQGQPDEGTSGPESGYRGAENQLYRVEIHRGGAARPTGGQVGGATFKWSRENGSVTFPVTHVSSDSGAEETTVFLSTLGRDLRHGLASEGDWVEIVDDTSVLRRAYEPLLQVARIDELTAVVRGWVSGTTAHDEAQHPLVRRWDHDASDPSSSDEGALLVRESDTAEDGWIELEDGVMVQFPASSVETEPNEYRPGDYWLIPARTATSDVVWPRRRVGGSTRWEARPARAIEHHYAPLAVATMGENGHVVAESRDCRRSFSPLATEDGA